MKKYLIDGEEVSERQFYDTMFYETQKWCENNYWEYLDRKYGKATLCGVYRHTGEVYVAVDPENYQKEFDKYVYECYDEFKESIEQDYDFINDTEFEVVEE